MQPICLLLLLLHSSIFGMEKSYYSSYEYKTYEYQKPTIHSLTPYEPDKNAPNRVFFQVTATESHFYIPVQPKKKEPSYIEKQVMKLAEKYEKVLYERVMGVYDLRNILKNLRKDFNINHSGMNLSEKMIKKQEIALLESLLAKYGIPDLEQIQGALPIKQAVGLYRGLLQKKHVDQKVKDAALQRLERRKSYELFLRQEQIDVSTKFVCDNSKISKSDPPSDTITLLQACDLVSTPVHRVPNISKEVDLRIEEALKSLSNAVSSDYLQSVEGVLQKLKSDGLLEPSQDLMRMAIIHGVKHFLNEFNPSSVYEHPKEFAINVATYTGLALFHIATDGVFIGTEKAILLGAQLQSLSELMSRDYSELSPNQCAELIAEKIADFIKIIVADKVARKAMPGLKRSGPLTSSHTNNALEASAQEAVTPEGLVVSGPHVLEETNVLKNTSEKARKTVSQTEKAAVQSAKTVTRKDEVRRIILNRERDVLPSDLKELGFWGERCRNLRRVDKETGHIYLFTEITGNIEKAHQIFDTIKEEFAQRLKLVEKVYDSARERTFLKFSDGTKIQLRLEGKSGHPKIEILDIAKNIEEKITFI